MFYVQQVSYLGLNMQFHTFDNTDSSQTISSNIKEKGREKKTTDQE